MSEAQTEAPKIDTEKGIKESLEIIKGLGVAVPAAVEILADGKLSAKDVKPVVESVKHYQVVVDAVKGSSEALGEAKDYSMEELAILGAAVLVVVKDTKEAYARGK